MPGTDNLVVSRESSRDARFVELDNGSSSMKFPLSCGTGCKIMQNPRKKKTLIKKISKSVPEEDFKDSEGDVGDLEDEIKK